MRFINNGRALFAGIGLTVCVMSTASTGAQRERSGHSVAPGIVAQDGSTTQGVDPVVEEPLRPLFPAGVDVDQIGPDACGATGAVMPSLGLVLTVTMQLTGQRRRIRRRASHHSKARNIDA